MAAQMRSDEAPSPAFFKVILQDTIEANKLMIPTKFVREHRSSFLDYVNLIVPNGQSWKIGLTKSDDKIYFDRNWLEFVQNFSIKEKYFLTFILEGISTLEVRIYPPSGCEILYPIMSTTPPRKTNSEEGECSKMPSSSKKNQQTTNRSKDVIGEAEVEPEKNENDEIEHEKTSLGNGNIGTELPCFKILMQPYNFKHKIVHLPTKFGTILKQTPEFINLQTTGGQWSVRLSKQVAEGKYDRFRLGNGWGDFRDENYLKIGDVCAIEIINNNLWKVTIFRD
ncbi:B3 domain-containing transcription factor VRN1-like [Mercurialis annua]|uniref:B3 domain-containing transcription factor VRN1-like n=1 Tax=Mercurialis annua TaxID=3986 RepID=UPI00215E0E4C|nr:B3 domain-containing transcription factor VRN1-like [Mercurialis annua]XP_055961733.1 B3 domain-containing transcription factor VRN1-like [Mercurialis annua]XP_055961734.1 B3 domain-containing transcription factor VRN1-like [Mercurialis annua]XP_055961735.1 B3 domain-containing transcription factor VRN1-like [Mercurialis annua]